MNPFDAGDRAVSLDEFVPFTARMMAAMRAKESARSDRLFDDPFAAQLAGDVAFQQVEQRLTPQDQAYVAIRTRFFDDFLLRSPVPQVVILAAGLDTRAYRLPWSATVNLYELDYPQVLDYKAAHLQAVQPTCNHHLLAADLTQPWQDVLLTAGYRSDLPSFWLIEGLLMYLSEAQVHTILATVSQVAAPDSWLGLDLINVKSLDYEPYKGFFQSGCDQPEKLLADYGWSATVFQPGDAEANFGRDSWLSLDRAIADVERVFLVEAKKHP